jgi:two-component system, OmpR family, response regulator
VEAIKLQVRPERAEEMPSEPTAGPPRARILVVDDEVWVRDLLYEFLRAEGYTVTDEALGALRRDSPDLVLLDIGLPDIDGLEVLRRIRAADPGLGVIILTGNQDVVLARAGLQIGAVDCLFKPSGLDRLGSAVALSLERLRASKVGAV